jgi:hypothetical protein
MGGVWVSTLGREVIVTRMSVELDWLLDACWSVRDEKVDGLE